METIRKPLAERLGAVLGAPVHHLEPLPGGCIASVYRVDLADGRRLVAKYASEPDGTLPIEGDMLRFLRAESVLPPP